MKRPMCSLAVAWLAGILTAGYGTGKEIMFLLFSYFILIILLLLYLKRNPGQLTPYVQREWYPQLTLLLFLIPCMLLLGHGRMEHFLAEQEKLERPWKLLYEEGEHYVTVEGCVKEKQADDKIVLELEECVIVGYYGQENQTAGNCRVRMEAEKEAWLPEVFCGNRIRVFGKLFLFSEGSNPGQFDAKSYYNRQGMYADISALRVTVLKEEQDVVSNAVLSFKQRFRESLLSLYPQEKAGVLNAMILGDKDLLTEDVEELYQRNSISHILAVSGLHISMLCMGLFRFLRKLTVPLKTASALSICFLIFYIFLAGVSTSSLRAGIMCLVMLGAILARRSYDLLSSLSLAAIIVTFLRPSELTSAGFLLSFGAVLGVALAQEIECAILQTYDGKRPWWCVFLFGGMIQCVTIPVSLWFFYELSPYGSFLNLVVIPLVSLVLGGGILSGILGMYVAVPARLSSGGTYAILEFYEWLCKVAQKLPFSSVLIGRPSVWQIVFYYVVLVFSLWWFFRRVRKTNQTTSVRWLCTLGLSVILLVLPKSLSSEILFLDVSQGDGVLISTEDGRVILSDCGSSDVTNVGEYRLFPALKHKGIMLVDMAVVSHLDSDHISGIRKLLEAMPVYEGKFKFAANYEGTVGVKELVLPKVSEKSEAYLALETLALEKNVAIRYAEAGEMVYQEESLLLECLSPCDARASDNETSLVLLLQTPELLCWLMGDAGVATEAEVMERLTGVDMETLRVGKRVLLKVGHHGSKTSSGEAFIKFVRPDFSVISCGYANTYGHPHASVVERLLAADSEVFRTDLQGAVVVKVGHFGVLEVSGWRKNQRK